jgi:hypothetical protein
VGRPTSGYLRRLFSLSLPFNSPSLFHTTALQLCCPCLLCRLCRLWLLAMLVSSYFYVGFVVLPHKIHASVFLLLCLLWRLPPPPCLLLKKT